MDCLRTAIRSGARRTVCIYRRDLANMPGSRREYKNAIEEGAEFVFLASPVALEGAPGGRVRGVRCQRMGLGEPDEKGRRAPVALPDSEFCVAADVVLVAYGFDPAPLPAGGEWDRIARNHWGGLVVDYNCMTSLPRVFAGGDQVRGADLVVHAVRDGRKAASGIHRFLSAKR
jgi:glutamate synthase (NADPH/NADH) small chain